MYDSVDDLVGWVLGKAEYLVELLNRNLGSCLGTHCVAVVLEIVRGDPPYSFGTFE